MFFSVLVVLISIVVCVYIGYRYVHDEATRRATTRHTDINRRRDYVKKHMDVFGVLNNGVSLDTRELYALKPDELGFVGECDG